MSLWKAIVLGLVQGLTEFLPVSSSGHLVLIKHFLHIDLESGGLFFDVMLHLGTLLAIFAAFWKDICRLFTEGLHMIGDCFSNTGRLLKNISGKNRVPYHKIVRSSYRKFVVLLLCSTAVTAAVVLPFRDIVEQVNGSVLVTGICLLITAGFLLIADIADPGEKKPKDAGYIASGLIGAVQGIATLPGISRSGSTITACILAGFDRRFAVKYSFIMSVPAVLGAVILEVKDIPGVMLTNSEAVYCAIATVVAAISGYLSICFLVKLVQKRPFKFFAGYCLLAGAVVLVSQFLAK